MSRRQARAFRVRGWAGYAAAAWYRLLREDARLPLDAADERAR